MGDTIMKTVSLKNSISLARVGLFVSSVALGGYLPDNPPAETIDSCIAEIGDNADYSGASKVRHELTNIGRRSLAYRLRISTAVYDESGDNVIRAYTTKCIVYGDDEPVFFDIRETRDGA